MQVIDPGTGTAAIVIQVVTAGGFGALVFFLVTKAIPKMIEDQRKDMQMARELFEKIITAKDDAYRKDMQADRHGFQETLVRIEDAHKVELENLEKITREWLALAREKKL